MVGCAPAGNVEGDERISNGSRFNANGAYGAVKFWNPVALIWSDAAVVGAGLWRQPDPRWCDTANDRRLMQRAEQAAPETVAALDWPHGGIRFRQSDESIYRRTAYQIIGGRMTFARFPVHELGASRIMQWGGGRPESFSNFGMGWPAKIIQHQTINEAVTSWLDLTLSWSWNPHLAGRLASMGRWLVKMVLVIYLPNMFLGVSKGIMVGGKDAINWYLEAHDTPDEYEPNQL